MRDSPVATLHRHGRSRHDAAVVSVIVPLIVAVVWPVTTAGVNSREARTETKHVADCSNRTRSLDVSIAVASRAAASC